MNIDKPTAADLPDLQSLWKEAFGDTDDFIACFFSQGFSPNRCRRIKKDGILAALYWFDCAWQDKKLAYIYGVDTDVQHQGKGLCTALLKDTHKHLQEQGYFGAVLVPGSVSLREFYRRFGYEEFAGESVEYHPSGCVTFAILGTKADQADKLAFDPDRKKRRAFYSEVKELFSEYRVFIGGSSSFDMAPAPYDKRYALEKYCKEKGYLPEEVLFIGDDYGEGGNDESVYLSDFNFLKIDDYRTFPELTKFLLD